MPVSEEQIVRILLRDRDKILAYVQSLVRDAHTAEDVLQDISMNALRSRDRIADEDHLLNWFRLAARHKCIAVLRQKTNRPAVISDELLDQLDAQWEMFDGHDSTEMMDALQSCRQRLSPYAKRLMDLRYIEGLTGQKLADMVNRKVETVYVAISRIHKALSQCIRKTLREEGGKA